MIINLKQLTLAGLTALSCTVLAEPNIYQQLGFEYKAEIHTQGNNAIQTLELPESIQSKLQDARGQDIQVYNANDELIPSIVKYEHEKSVESISSALIFYPLKADPVTKVPSNGKSSSATTPSAKIEVKLQVQMDTQVSLTKETAPQIDLAPQSYILENPRYQKESNLPGKLNQLEFKWEDSFEGIAALTLETGNDLNQWKTLIKKDTLVDMQFMEQHLNKNTLPVSGKATRYLKLTWTGQYRPVITAVTANFSQKTQKPAYQWSDNLSLTRVTDPTKGQEKNKNTFSAWISPAFKTDRFRLVTVMDNQIVTGTLSRNFKQNTQQKKPTEFRFYKITTAEGDLSKLEQPIISGNKAFWQFHFKYPQGIDVANKVSIQVNRYPLNLYFLKQGDGPFYLAYGNKGTLVKDKNISSIVSSLIKQSPAGFDVVRIGNIETITPLAAAEAPLDWKQILLWLVLIGGVLMMLIMAKGLFKQINQTN